jgi:hypothetical protein
LVGAKDTIRVADIRILNHDTPNSTLQFAEQMVASQIELQLRQALPRFVQQLSLDEARSEHGYGTPLVSLSQCYGISIPASGLRVITPHVAFLRSPGLQFFFSDTFVASGKPPQGGLLTEKPLATVFAEPSSWF